MAALALWWPVALALLLLRLPAVATVAHGRPTRASSLRPAAPQRRRASRLLASREREADGGGSALRVGFGEQSVVDALAAIRRGEMVVVTDDESRENEGDLIMAAEFATAESIAFMVRHTSGVLCVGMESDRIDELRLPQMVGSNEDPKGTAFTVSVDARVGTSTGISAADRAETLRQLAMPGSTADDFQRPGHVFPLRARQHGVLARQGHTEAAVDLCRLAKLAPAGVLCELVSADGLGMARMPELQAFAKAHSLAMTTITDLVSAAQRGSGRSLSRRCRSSSTATSPAHRRSAAARSPAQVAYRLRHDTLVEQIGTPARMPTKFGAFEAYAFRSLTENLEHIALCKGGPFNGTDAAPLLVRVHSECCTGDVFGSLRCDCGTQLEVALRRIEAEGTRAAQPAAAAARSPAARLTPAPARRAAPLAPPLLPRRPRRAPLPARAGGARHWARPQDPRVRAAGPRPRHGAGQRGPGPTGRLARLRRWRAGPAAARRLLDAAHDQQPGQGEAPATGGPRARRAPRPATTPGCCCCARRSAPRPSPPDPSLRAAQYAGLSGYGLSIAERVPCMTAVNVENVKYMRTKQQKMGHWLPVGFDDMVTELEEAVQLDLGVGAGDGGEPGGAAAELQEAGACALSLEEQIDEAASELARLRALLGDSAVNGVSSASSRSSGVPGGEKNLSR